MHFKPKIDLNKRFSADTKIYRNFILYFFPYENKAKVGYFSKIAEIFSNAKNGPVCPDGWKLT